MNVDLAIVGGGIVGLATAMACAARFPSRRLAVLEKEPRLGAHQTTHNSGVIHTGIYYRPGSLKAKTCVEGARLMLGFCRTHGIPHQVCGKVIVAADSSEAPRLTQLAQRGAANGVGGLSLIGPERLRELEPHARGVEALHVPGAAIVDYDAVVRAMAEVIRQRGGEIRLSTRVLGCLRRDGGWMLETSAGPVSARHLVTCGGLFSDRLASMAGGPSDVRIVPFRGEYYELAPASRSLVRGMIYPVPDPAFPFLGVHFTRAIDGRVHAGPNAVLALKREGYRKTDVSARDLWDLASFSGFWKMAARHWRMGLQEWRRSWSQAAFVRALQRLVPEINAGDVVPGESGVRAQALNGDGLLLDDFNIVQRPQAIHVRNAPSPAATSSLAIGRSIADMAAASFNL